MTIAAYFLRFPEDVLRDVLVAFCCDLFVLFGQKLGVTEFKRVRDVREEDQAKDDMLVLRSVH